MQKKDSYKRLGYSITFALVCIGLGFMMATGWQTPSVLNADTTIRMPVKPASVPLIDDEGNSPFVAIAEKVQPVVVNITVEKEVASHPDVYFDLFDWGPFFGEPPRRNKSFKKPTITSGGSGIIIDNDGLILTNNHVVSEASKITIKFADDSEREAEVIGTDPETDVALIKVDSEIPAGMVARLGDSDKIKIGEWAIAIGNPFGLDWTLTVGVISARGRSNLAIGGGQGPSFQNFIQTDASINFGNSGGPLLNIHGEVIGINTAINAQGQGIGFAIPINQARKVAEKLLKEGVVKRGYLGVFPTELDEMKREALGIEDEINGVFIQSVEENTPAEEGGLRGGEVVLEIEDEPIENLKDFRFKIADFPPDSKVKMKVWQNGDVRTLKFKLGDRNEYLKIARTPVKQPDYWLGIDVANTDSPQGMRWGLNEYKGALVIGVAPDSPASGFLEPGDIIVEINGEEVRDADDFKTIAGKFDDRKRAIPFWVMRDGRRTFIPIRPDQG